MRSRALVLATALVLAGCASGESTDRGAGVPFGATIEEYQDLLDDIVNDTLYPDVTSSIEDFLTARDYKTVDVQPFVDTFFKDVLLKNRPS